MTDTEEAPERRSADPVLKDLTNTVTTLSTQSRELLDEVRQSNETIERDRVLQRQQRKTLKNTKRLLWVNAVATIAAVVLIFLNVQTGSQVEQSSDEIRDCTTPSGLCAKAGAARTAAAVLDIEVKRNETELGMAELRGDTIAADYRRQVVADLTEDVKAITAYADAIRRGENPKPPVLHER